MNGFAKLLGSVSGLLTLGAMTAGIIGIVGREKEGAAIAFVLFGGALMFGILFNGARKTPAPPEPWKPPLPPG
jgi:hypothetical protein